MNYRPSDEVDEAIKGASLGWATAKDETSQESEQEPENPDNGGGGGGGNGELEEG